MRAVIAEPRMEGSEAIHHTHLITKSISIKASITPPRTSQYPNFPLQETTQNSHRTQRYQRASIHPYHLTQRPPSAHTPTSLPIPLPQNIPPSGIKSPKPSTTAPTKGAAPPHSRGRGRKSSTSTPHPQGAQRATSHALRHCITTLARFRASILCVGRKVAESSRWAAEVWIVEISEGQGGARALWWVVRGRQAGWRGWRGTCFGGRGDGGGGMEGAWPRFWDEGLLDCVRGVMGG